MISPSLYLGDNSLPILGWYLPHPLGWYLFSVEQRPTASCCTHFYTESPRWPSPVRGGMSTTTPLWWAAGRSSRNKQQKLEEKAAEAGETNWNLKHMASLYLIFEWGSPIIRNPPLNYLIIRSKHEPDLNLIPAGAEEFFWGISAGTGRFWLTIMSF